MGPQRWRRIGLGSKQVSRTSPGYAEAVGRPMAENVTREPKGRWLPVPGVWHRGIVRILIPRCGQKTVACSKRAGYDNQNERFDSRRAHRLGTRGNSQ